MIALVIFLHVKQSDFENTEWFLSYTRKVLRNAKKPSFQKTLYFFCSKFYNKILTTSSVEYGSFKLASFHLMRNEPTKNVIKETDNHGKEKTFYVG